MTARWTRGPLALIAAALAGCATHAAGRGTGLAPPGGDARAAFHLQNWSLDRLDIYVVEETREWFLGRVEPGARVRLPLPADVRVDGREMVRLAVLANAPRSGRPSRVAGASLTTWQPLTRLLAQDWAFALGQVAGAGPARR